MPGSGVQGGLGAYMKDFGRDTNGATAVSKAI